MKTTETRYQTLKRFREWGLLTKIIFVGTNVLILAFVAWMIAFIFAASWGLVIFFGVFIPVLGVSCNLINLGSARIELETKQLKTDFRNRYGYDL